MNIRHMGGFSGKCGNKPSVMGNQMGPSNVLGAQYNPAQMGPAQMGPSPMGPSNVLGAQFNPTPMGPAQMGPTQVAPTQVAPTQVSPTQQFVNTNLFNTVVPHVHPSHTTTVNKHMINHQHYFPHTQSVVNECYEKHTICGCPPRPFGF